MAEQKGNIAQYTSPVDKLTPSDEGAHAYSEAGFTEDKLYRQAGADYKEGFDVLGGSVGKAVDDHEYMTELSQGSAAWSATFNSQMTEWQKAQAGADPNDKTIQQKFIDESLEPALNNFQSAFSTERGQQWAVEQANDMRREFYNRTSADMMTRAGEARMEDFKTSLNQAGATVYKDPTALDASFAHADSLLTAIKTSGQYDAKQVAEFDKLEFDWKNELAKTAVKGVMDNQSNPQGPAQGKALMDSGALDKWLSPIEKEELTHYAQEATRARQSDQDHAYLQQKRAQEQKDENFNTQVLNSVQADPKTGAITIPPDAMMKIFTTQGVSGKAKVETMEALDHVAKGTVVDDPQTARSNFENLGTLTQEDLRQQAAAGKITPERFKFWSDLVKNTPEATAEKGALTNAVSQTQKMILNTQVAGIQPSDEQRQKQIAFTNWFTTAYQAGMQDPALAGMTRQQRTQTLLSTGPKGLLSPDNLKPFLPSPATVQSDGIKKAMSLDPRLAKPAEAQEPEERE